MSITTQEAAGARTFDHGTIGRFNAWFFDTFDRYINAVSRRRKQRAFADIDPGRVLEIGAGVGANFDCLPPGTRFVAVEPNVAMHARLAHRARERHIDLEVVGAPAGALPIPDASVDTVICSLVLCSVEDPAAAISEIRRVLRTRRNVQVRRTCGGAPAVTASMDPDRDRPTMVVAVRGLPAVS